MQMQLYLYICLSVSLLLYVCLSAKSGYQRDFTPPTFQNNEPVPQVIETGCKPFLFTNQWVMKNASLIMKRALDADQ